MQLLVSVRDAAEARLALAGGADIIDAKDPDRGALGAVALGTLHAIHHAVGGERPTSAALGDAMDEATIERTARSVGAVGVAYVKLGFFGIADIRRAGELLAAAVRGARHAEGGARRRVIAAAYADATRAGSVDPRALIDVAMSAEAAGVLLDTAFKDAGGLFTLLSRDAVSTWITAAHAASLTVALAGKLTAAELAIVRDLGADIAGVRGAACEGGRRGAVSSERVRALAEGAGSPPTSDHVLYDCARRG